MAGIAETQDLIVRIRYIQDKSGLRNLSADIEQAAAQSGAKAQRSGLNFGQRFAKGFNQGAQLGRLGDIGSSIAAGGLKFLERTVLATAAAGVVLEYQFLKVQDAQAAMARTLEGESAPALAKLNAEILELSKVIPLPITELYRIGDCLAPRRAHAAILEGERIGRVV